MRALPQIMQDAFAGGATTFCRCWVVTRTDSVTLGFTDHDRALSFDGIVFEASAGFSSEAVEAATGLGVGTHTVAGALNSGAITDADIERGLYDGAEVALWLADWRDVSSRLLLSRGLVGEIRRGSIGFEAEIVGLAERLNQPFGRAFLRGCTHKLGDARCGIDLSLPQFRGVGIVDAVIDPQRFAVTGLSGFASGWFSGGALTWTTGSNGGDVGQVKTHLTAGGTVTVELWLTPSLVVVPGDLFAVTAGCNKAAATCKEKFSNLLNFGGFPHMPGDDWVASYVDAGGQHDGGSLLGR